MIKGHFSAWAPTAESQKAEQQPGGHSHLAEHRPTRGVPPASAAGDADLPLGANYVQIEISSNNMNRSGWRSWEPELAPCRPSNPRLCHNPAQIHPQKPQLCGQVLLSPSLSWEREPRGENQGLVLDADEQSLTRACIACCWGTRGSMEQFPLRFISLLIHLLQTDREMKAGIKEAFSKPQGCALPLSG